MTKTFLFFTLSLLLSACSLPFNGGNRAALNIQTTPKAAVFLDSENIGSTPYYGDTLKPGDYTLKLIPEGSESQPWETRISLHSGIFTIVNRELGETSEKSSGYVLSLDKQSDQDKASLLVVTTPDGSVVTVDGEPRGFSPVSISNLTALDHTVVISSPGYTDKSFKAQLVNGYKLTANVQLAKSDKTVASKPAAAVEKAADEPEMNKKQADEVIDADVSDEKTADSKPEIETDVSVKPEPNKDLKPPYVIIKETTTGWLNVRSEPSTAKDNIITQVDPGEKYKFIEKNAAGWYQIQVNSSKKGWISSKYATLVEK